MTKSLPRLSSAEKLILQGLATGHSSNDIARWMQKDLRDIHAMRCTLMEKLGAKTMAQLGHMAALYQINCPRN